jgi:hypothetical protein
MASQRHGGAGSFTIISQSLIRRGGAPSGAAAFIATGWGYIPYLENISFEIYY